MQNFTWSSLLLKACQSLSGKYYLHKQGIYGIMQQIEQVQTGQSVQPWKENAKLMQKMAWTIIENWDIRRAGALFEIFPDIIPKRYRGKDFAAEYNEKGNWIIIF